MTAESPDRIGLEQIRVVLHVHLQPFRPFNDLESQVRLRRSGADGWIREGKALKRDCPRRQILEDEHDLEEHRVAHIPRRLQNLDQPFEREFLTGVRVKGFGAHPEEQLAERGVVREVSAEHERID